MKSYLKKSIALILSLMVTLSMMPSLVFALDEPLASENLEAQVFAEEQTEENTSDEVEEHSENENAEVDKVAEDNRETDAVESSEEDGSEDSDSESSTDTETVKETAPAGEKTEEAKEDTAEEVKMPAFNQSKTSDGVKVTVKAAEGIFPEGAYLDVRKATEDEAAKTDKAVELKRGDNVNVALTYTFDIKVLDKDGKELQPADGMAVNVSFETEEVADSNLTTDVYHVIDKGGTLKADALDVKTDGDTASASTDGFSYYTVEFTYGELQYSMHGDSEVGLQDILENVGISGTATAATSSNPDLFSVEQQGGEFVVVARKAFKNNETLTVTVDGIDYVIKVTDAVTYYTSTCSTPLDLKEGDTLVVDANKTMKITVSGDNVTINVQSGKTLKISDHIKVTNANFTLNMAASASLTPSSSTAYHLYLDGKGAAVNINGNSANFRSTLARRPPTTSLYFGNVGAELNIAEGVQETLGLKVLCVISQDGNTAGEVTINAKGTFNSRSGTLPMKTPINVTKAQGGLTPKATVNIWGILNTWETIINGSAEFIGQTNEARVIANGEEMQNIGISVASAAGNEASITLKNLTVECNETGRFMYSGSESNVRIENVKIAEMGQYNFFDLSGVSVLKNVEAVRDEMPSSQSQTRFNIIGQYGNSLEIDGCRFVNIGAKYAVRGYGGAILTIKDTEITGFKCATEISENSVITLDGTTSIKGNVGDDGKEKNLYIKEGSKFTVADTFIGSVGVSSEIAPTEENPVIITTDGTERVCNIYSDDPAYSIGYQDNHHVLMVHSHDWHFAAGKVNTDNDSLMAWCTQETNPECIYKWAEGAAEDTRVKMTINTKDGAKKYTYDETSPVERPAVVENKDMMIGTTTGSSGAIVSVGEIEYYDKDGAKMSSVPVLPGTYTAKVVATVGGEEYILQTSYKIKGASPVPEPTNPIYNGQAQALLTIEPDEEYTVLYNTTDGDPEGQWSETIPEGTNAGSYDVWFMYQGDPDSIEKIDDATIEKATVTVSGITASNKVYDGNTDATVSTEGATFAGKIDGDKLTVSTTGSFADKNVGQGKVVTLGAFTLGGESADNYKLAETGNQGTAEADITKCPVKVSGITAEDKDYDGNTDATLITSGVSFDGIVGEDALTVTATGTFDNANAGQDKTVNISGLTLGGTDVSNYELASEGQQSTATATIKALPMTVSATGYNGTYDESNHHITVTVTAPTSGYTITYKGPEDQEYSDANPEFQNPGEYVVSYKVTADNYEETTGTATVKIIGADFTGITSDGYSAVYDGGAHGITVNVPDTYSGYTVSYSATGTGTYSTDPVTYTDFTDGARTVYFKVSKKGYNDFTGSNTVNITKRPVTVSDITASNKVYDGKIAATVVTENASFDGIVSGDRLTVSTTGNFDTKDVGTEKKVTLGTLTLGGESAGNYSIKEDSQTEAKANITKRPVKVSGITASDKTYDGNTTAALTFTGASFEGLVEGDTLSVKGETTQDGTFNDKNVGTGKTVTLPALALDGNDAANYTIGDDSQTTATAAITAKEVRVTAEDKSKTYGEDDPALTYTADALVTGDEFTGVLTRAEGEDAGTYDINQGTLSAGDNYTIKYTKGTFTINQATTNEVTASIEGWTYGDNPKTPSATADYGQDTVTFAYSNTEDGEYKSEVPKDAGTWYVKATVPGTTNYVEGVSKPVEFTIAQKEVGLEWGDTEFIYNGEAQKPVATATGLVDGDECYVTVDGAQTDANAKSDTDSYTATAVSLSNTNYKLPDSTTTEFTIAQKEITITGITAADKTYDGNTDAALDYSSVDYSGKVGSDDVSVTAKGQFDNKNVGTDKTVTISDIVLGGEAKDNYVLAKQGQQETATANINKKVIAVTAEDKSKTYLEDDPALTYTADELVTGDSFTGALERAEGEDAGTYDINQGTLSAGDNYTINYTKGTFTINQATTNEVTASIEGWTYGDSPKDPSATATYGQDTVTFAYSDSKDGDYKTDVPTDAGTWYVKATVPGTTNYVEGVSKPVEFTIEQKEVGLEWSDTDLTYNGNAQKPKATATDLVDGDECDVTVDGAQTDANAKSGTEVYEAAATALSNPNYKFPDSKTTEFTIAPKNLAQSMLSIDNDVIKADGTKQGPVVTMTDEDIKEGDNPKKMAEGDDYTLSGNVTSSELGTHFFKIEGKGNYTGSLETSWVLIKEESNADTEKGVDGAGDIKTFVSIENNTEPITVDNFTMDFVKSLLTEEELARLDAGEDITIYVETIEEPKSDASLLDRTELEALFKLKSAKDIRWFDIKVWKKIGTEAATPVHELKIPLKMSFSVPDEYENAPADHTRTFFFGRAHSGLASIISETTATTVTVSSDKFSTYALAYTDTENPKDTDDNGDNESNGSNNGSNGSDNGSSSSKGAAKTGDSNDIAGLMALMFTSAGALGATVYRRRRETGK